MNKERISGTQLKNLMIQFILGSTLLAGGVNFVSNDLWLAVVIAILAAVPVLLMYGRLCSMHRDKDIYDLFYDSLGKTAGFIFTLLFLLFSLYLSAAVLRNLTEFVQLAFFPDTPQYVVAIFTGITVLYSVKKGIEVMARGVSYVVYIIIGLLLITISLSVKDMDVRNLFPLFSNNPKQIYDEVILHLSFPYLETVMFTSITPSLNRTDSPYKSYIYSLLISGAVLLLLYLRNLLVLGAYVMKNVYYPAYITISLINIADFITRIEVIVTINYVFCVVLKVTICILSACKALCKVTKVKDYKVYGTPCVLFTIFFSAIIFEDTMDMFNTLLYSRYAFLFFQVFMILVTYLFTEYKFRKNKVKN